jgi:hypothetical protein
MAATIEQISYEIRRLKETAIRLESLSTQLPALRCNLKRIQASIKMLELNFVDPIEICE